MKTYDSRGHGASPVSCRELGLDEFAADLEALHYKLGIAQAHFALHSLGVMNGPTYTRLYRNQVLSLSLLSTAAFGNENYSAKIWDIFSTIEDIRIPNILPN